MYIFRKNKLDLLDLLKFKTNIFTWGLNYVYEPGLRHFRNCRTGIFKLVLAVFTTISCLFGKLLRTYRTLDFFHGTNNKFANNSKLVK